MHTGKTLRTPLTAGIIDCEVEDWIPGPCFVSCDDSCPDLVDPYQCGGWQMLSRWIITAPDPCGLWCQATTVRTLRLP